YADECAGKGRLRWRAHANSDERRVGSTRDRAAGSASLTQELRLIARGPAIGGKQDFIVLALHRAARNAIRSDDTDAWARRTRRAFLTLRTRRSGRPGRTDRTSVAFWARRTSRALFALRTLAAAGDAGEQSQRHHQMRHTHCHILPEKCRAPIQLEDQTRQLGARTHARTPALAARKCFV